eukprot:3882747-Amphidinium_carterae.1
MASDAEMAYIQATLQGIKTWVRLPKDQWPAAWRKMRDPVCPLVRAPMPAVTGNDTVKNKFEVSDSYQCLNGPVCSTNHNVTACSLSTLTTSRWHGQKTLSQRCSLNWLKRSRWMHQHQQELMEGSADFADPKADRK